ncbi:flagellar hook-associated protein 3 FlgL [Pseudorhizobium tarimense]|uniref:Flagellin n=1 Tax=Pseudorhizobium tarimense TaxID=1079109 RepID=A0ABV2HAP4_9HYPH|nr:flagellar hook-associated family protein [Pseudorhizobium tarimense]MCJ8520840.1 flagellar hook-associated family protein [Pseudorhizobium tarimense]
MKTSFISSLSVQTTMRYAVAKAQQDMVAAQQEVTTGRHADVGVALGATTARSLDLTRDVLRIKSMLTTNSLATQRLESSEEALSKMSDQSQEMMNALITLGDSTDATMIATFQTSIQTALDTVVGFANTSVNGEYLFAGINTDVKPLENISDADSAAREAIDRELDLFLADQVPPVTKDQMTEAQANAFLTKMEEIFAGKQVLTPVPPETVGEDFWSTFVSNASDASMRSRVSQSEIVDTSTSANEKGVRDLVFTAFVSEMFLNAATSDEGRKVAAARAMASIGTAKLGIDQERTRLGLSAERVKKADESLNAQKNIIETHLNDLESVDAYEASTRVKGLEALIETAYTLTARLQQLSLVNFLQ